MNKQEIIADIQGRILGITTKATSEIATLRTKLRAVEATSGSPITPLIVKTPMNIDELNAAVDQIAEADSTPQPYVAEMSDDTICLDGYFNVEQARLILRYLEERQ